MDTATTDEGRLVSSLSVGDNADGLADRRIADSVDADVVRRIALADVDGDGLADYVAETGADGLRAHCHLQSLGGSTTATIRMQASTDSATSVHAADFDRDGNADLRVAVRVTPVDLTGVGFPAATLRLDADADDDGVADHTASLSRDAETAEMLLGDPGSGSWLQLRRQITLEMCTSNYGSGSNRYSVLVDSLKGEVTVGDSTGGNVVRLAGGPTVQGSLTISSGTLRRTSVNPDHVVLTTAGVGTLDTGIVLRSDGRVGIGVVSPSHPVHHSSGAT